MDETSVRLRALRRALAKRCPQCGRGALFRRWARLHEACPECGLVYRREDGAQTGSMYLSAAVTEVFAALVLAVLWLATDWDVPTAMAVGVPLVLVFSYAFLPYSMALWTAVEYGTDVQNGESWVEPRP